MKPKTLMPGIAKSRSGSPSIGLQTLIDRTKMSAFSDELTKLSEDPPTRAEVSTATKELKKPVGKRLLNPLEGGVIAGAASPGVQALGRGLKGAINGAKNEAGEQMTRRAAAMQGIRGTTKGDIASSALVSALGVSALAMGRDAMQVHHAKKVLRDAEQSK